MTDPAFIRVEYPPKPTISEEREYARRIEAGVLAQEWLRLGFYSDSGSSTNREPQILGQWPGESRTVKASRRELEVLVVEGRSAWETMLLANQRLISWELFQNRNIQKVGIDELSNEGMVALMKALYRYDYRKELRFSTYALPWIRYALFRAVRELPEISVGECGDIPTSKDVLNESIFDLSRVWRRLDLTTQEILQHRFGLSGPVLSYRQIAIRLGISVSRVRRVESSALVELRGWLTSEAA